MILRGASGPIPWPLWGLLVTLVVGVLLGAHQRDAFAGFSLGFSYGYWVLRLAIAYLLFAGGLALLELSPLSPRIHWGWLALASALITLPLFTLCVTMLDLLLGLPELGDHAFGFDSEGAALSAGTMLSLFGMESLYHLDNHLALCALIVVPRLLLAPRPEVAASAPVPLRAPRPEVPQPAPAFLERFEPPVKGQVFVVQAQEHYVRVVTAEGAGTTLYRFGDALRELEGLTGLQVHRSFWVADAGVAGLKQDRRGLRIVLRNGEQVPVSARHADLVQRRFAERLGTVA
jgi:hypothetical protein